MQGCRPQHLRMGAARRNQDKESEGGIKSRGQKEELRQGGRRKKAKNEKNGMKPRGAKVRSPNGQATDLGLPFPRGRHE